MQSGWRAKLAFLAICGAITAAKPALAEPPAKLAAGGRFDLTADDAVAELDTGAVLSGHASLGRFHWLPAGQQERGYSVNFPAVHFAWREVEVRFTPRHSGSVQLSLMGPWEQQSPGQLYQEDVLWGEIALRGATWERPPFRWTADHGWVAAEVRTTHAAPSEVLEGKTYLRTWHNRPVNFALAVEADQPVTMRLSARAALPPGFVDMRRIDSRQTPAHLAMKLLQHGVNAGNSLEAPPGQDWGASYTASDFQRMHSEGFDHVRLPVGWQYHTGPGPEFTIEPAFLAKVDELVDAALASGLAVIVDVHNFDQLTSHPREQTDKFVAIWRQLARHYAARPGRLAFDLLNEPKDAATTAVMNSIYALAIQAVRQASPERTIFVGPGRWNAIDELSALRLPDDDQNVIVTVHCYDPFLFTHQGASWTQPTTATTGIVFPGPPASPLEPAARVALDKNVTAWLRDYNTLPAERNPSSSRAFAGKLRLAREWSEYYGRPVHIGEFGCYIGADPASRARYYAEFRRTADENGLGWAAWDWKANFRYWDEAAGRPAPGMREALFGKSAVQ